MSPIVAIASSVPTTVWKRRCSFVSASVSPRSSLSIRICFSVASAFAGRSARRLAQSSATSTDVPSGTTRFTPPSSWMRCAVMGAPSSTISAVAVRPMMRASRLVPPMPVVSAIWISGCPKRACSSAMRRSQAHPSSAPPPEQSPEMAAIVTTGVFASSCRQTPQPPPVPVVGSPMMVLRRSRSQACSYQCPGVPEASTDTRAPPSRASTSAAPSCSTPSHEPWLLMSGFDMVMSATPSRGRSSVTISGMRELL